MKCLIYARVSTDKQAEKELSIPAQLQAMRDYARQRDWAIIEEFLEPGASARTADRPELQRLLARCRVDNKPDVVLVHKIDRLARNVFDHATIRALLKQHGIRLASVVENVDESVSGELVENIMASIAQFYSGNLSDEVKKGMRQKIEQGGWPHQPPRGYRVQHDPSGRSTIVIDPALTQPIRHAFQSYSTGHRTLNDIRMGLFQEGAATAKGTPLPLEGVRQMLMNPFYAGRLRWGGSEYPGAHEPLISERLFLRVQEMLRRRHQDSGERGRLHFLIRGLAYCAGCGNKVTAEQHGRFSYYRCIRNCRPPVTCRAPYSNVQAADRALDTLCRRLVVPTQLKSQIQDEAERIANEHTAAAQRQLASAKMQRSKVTDREATLTEAFVNGDVSLKAYRTTMTKIRGRLAALESVIDEATQDPRALSAKVARILAVADSVGDLLTHLTGRRRQDLLRIIFKRIVLDTGAIVSYELNTPFAELVRERDQDDRDTTGKGGRADLELTQVKRAIKLLFEFDTSGMDALFAAKVPEAA